MIRILSLFAALVLFGFGCASNSDYGIKPSPLVQEMEGKDSGSGLESQITKENQEARQERDAPIFNYDGPNDPE